MLCKLPPSRSRHADRELGACPEAALGSQNSGLEPYQCWLQRNLIMQRLALLSWAAAAVALRPVPKPQLVQTKAAKRVGAQLAGRACRRRRRCRWRRSRLAPTTTTRSTA